MKAKKINLFKAIGIEKVGDIKEYSVIFGHSTKEKVKFKRGFDNRLLITERNEFQTWSSVEDMVCTSSTALFLSNNVELLCGMFGLKDNMVYSIYAMNHNETECRLIKAPFYIRKGKLIIIKDSLRTMKSYNGSLS